MNLPKPPAFTKVGEVLRLLQSHFLRIQNEIEQADRQNLKRNADIDHPHALTLRGDLSLADVTAGITAYAGGGQANATELLSSVNYVETAATTDDSIKLPAATGSGRVVIVAIGDVAATTVGIYPQSGEKIDDLAADAKRDLGDRAGFMFVDIASGEWSLVG